MRQQGHKDLQYVCSGYEHLVYIINYRILYCHISSVCMCNQAMPDTHLPIYAC